MRNDTCDFRKWFDDSKMNRRAHVISSGATRWLNSWQRFNAMLKCSNEFCVWRRVVVAGARVTQTSFCIASNTWVGFILNTTCRLLLFFLSLSIFAMRTACLFAPRWPLRSLCMSILSFSADRHVLICRPTGRFNDKIIVIIISLCKIRFCLSSPSSSSHGCCVVHVHTNRPRHHHTNYHWKKIVFVVVVRRETRAAHDTDAAFSYSTLLLFNWIVLCVKNYILRHGIWYVRSMSLYRCAIRTRSRSRQLDTF